MRSTEKLKKLTVDIISLVLVFGVIASILFIEQSGYRVNAGSNSSSLIDEDTWYAVRNLNAGSIPKSANKCLLVYASNDEECVALRDNFEYVLSSINVSVTLQAMRVPEEDDDPAIDQINTINEFVFENYDDIIFCTSNLSYLGVNYSDLEEWVSRGGHLMFAAGLQPTVGMEQLQALLGLSSSDNLESVMADSMQFHSSILAGAEERTFSDDVINCEVLSVPLSKACKVHASTCDDENIPLLWENRYGDGTVIVCNADILDSKADRGLVAAIYCQFYSA